jgi:hypothetical protein
VLLVQQGEDEDTVKLSEKEYESPRMPSMNFGMTGRRWSGNDGVLYIVGMDRDFIVSSQHIDLREDGTTEQLVAVIMDVTDRVWVGDSMGV